MVTLNQDTQRRCAQLFRRGVRLAQGKGASYDRGIDLPPE